MPAFHDVVIIGSGASGSVMAHYLTRAGADCVMLEAGQAYEACQYPRNEMHANARLFWGGGMDATTTANLLFLRGKVLGGGTVVNQALLDRFDDLALDDWRERSGIDFFTTDDMARHYDAVEAELSLHTLGRDEWNRNAELYARGFEQCGYRWAPLRRGQSHCNVAENDCMACLGGCRRDSKQSMPVTFLGRARQQGLSVETGFQVTRISHHPDHVEVQGVQHGEQRRLCARKCVLAAGALGSTALMLNSGFRSRLPALGEGFFSHPQWMNLALFDDIVDAHKGALQAVKSDEPDFRRRGFKLENVFVGPIGVSMLIPEHGRRQQHYLENYRRLASMEVCIRDVIPGTIRVTGKGRLRIRKPICGEDLRRGRDGVAVVREIYQALGAREFITSNFNFSLHQMGGCAIGSSPERAVVDPVFRVFGMENIHIADGSVFPSAPGINPSLTIMANSHHASELMLAEFGERPAKEGGA
jgi:choline dehydrogenase-like flavoprotein